MSDPKANSPSRSQIPEKDNEGFLLDPAAWSRELALEIAAEEKILLTPEHWVVIDFVRERYEERHVVPEARAVLKHLKERANGEEDKASRRYLYSLFPFGYGQQACKIAGMRKPLKLMLDV